MPTLEGRTFSLAQAQKTHPAVVILFISTICPYSNSYNERMRDMASDFGEKGVVFVGVNSGTLETKLSSPDLQTAIEALMDGKPIRPAQTKAFGCAIARR